MPINITSGNFDLALVIKQHLLDTEAADPRTIADELLDRGLVPKRVYERIVRAAMKDIVREYIRQTRRPHIRLGAENMAQRVEGSGYRYWRVHWGNGDYEWLDNFTQDMLWTVAAQYRRRAIQNDHVAEEFERIAALFEEFDKAVTVADLPETRVREIGQIMIGIQEEDTA